MKNIHKLFIHLDIEKYKDNKELESYIWCIIYISKQWLDGIVNIELIVEGAKRTKEYDNIKDEIITSSMNDPNIITPPEAKLIFDLIGEALQYGFITSIRGEYISLLDDISLDNPGSFKETADRLFKISQSLLDIKYNTNLIANKITFNTADEASMREAITQTISSLSIHNTFKTGIRRLNTLLSPGYMSGRTYVFLGMPGTGKSLVLLKTALDIRKYNPDFQSKTPGMKPAVLYVTMENTFHETIERIWNMCFDDNLANYSEEEALHKLGQELGISHEDIKHEETGLATLLGKKKEYPNIEVVIKYFPYREISTDDLFTIISDLKEEGYETCALILDYIKRIRPSEVAPDNVKLELDRIVNELKALAVISDIPVITAHQLNRSAASTFDNAVRQGKTDSTKLIGREHVGSALVIWRTINSFNCREHLVRH
jgi:hypothetical protein